ncbi:MAG: Mut7-C RNAse domain-containing protein [Chloroflexi bacterium]|nr:Mut7-C RNAse domain-containing protein [Chloroflexota bacterium]
MEISFIADSNVGKLARWLRMMGYDALFCRHIDDSDLVRVALEQGRVILTRDAGLMKRRAIASGQLKAILTRSDNPKEQLRQVLVELKLESRFRQFTRCLECNQRLAVRSREEIEDSVPPYVFRTQAQYMQCPSCLRVYWQGSHWQRMREELDRLGT